MKILLVSNSGKPYLSHCRGEIHQTLGGCKSVGFISAASFGDEKAYFQKVVEAIGKTFEWHHIVTENKPLETLSRCDALLVGGGNTYRLLQKVRDAKLLPEVRKKVQSGMPYIGWSAGSNLAGPTILTTNDWNVVGLNTFEALNLVPFNINPHYKETDPAMAQFSETRDERIAEYHKVNSNPVLGIEEQTSIFVEGKKYKVVGQGRVRKFLPMKPPQDFKNGDTISL